MILRLVRRVVVHCPTACPRRDNAIGIRLEVLRSDSEFHRTVAVDGALQSCSVGLVDQEMRAVIVCLVVEREAVRLHRRHNVGEVSAI